MEQLSFSRNVTSPDESSLRQVAVSLLPEGVEVIVGRLNWAPIPWDKLDDVEHLSKVFWDLQVWEFRNVVELLAKALTYREHV